MTRRRLKEAKASNHWIGTRLAKLRRMRNMTQQEVGDILHRTDSAVSDIENGYSDITLDHLLHVAEGLGLPAAGLLLPEPGATSAIPYKGSNGVANPAIIELLSNQPKMQALSQILEALPRLSLEQLTEVAQNVSQFSTSSSSAA